VKRASAAAAWVLVVGACATGPPPRDDAWRRAFLATPDEVHSTAVEVLIDLDYEILEDDGERIRVRGRPPGTPRTVILELDVRTGDEWVVVEVQGRTDVGGGPADLDAIAQASAEVLGKMAERLQVL
jgi:hypothetical protein